MAAAVLLAVLIYGFAAISSLAAGTAYAQDAMTSQQAVSKSISSAHHSVPITANISSSAQQTGKISPPAQQNNNVTTKNKTRNSPILMIVAILFVVFLICSITFANYYSTRVCTSCGHIGKMRALRVSHQPVANTFLLAIIKMVPQILYFYADSGKFECPKCYKSDSNVSLRSSQKGYLPSQSWKRPKKRRRRRI